MAITSWNNDANYLTRTGLSFPRATYLPGIIISLFIRNPGRTNGGAIQISQAGAQGLDLRMSSDPTQLWAVSRSAAGYVWSQFTNPSGFSNNSWMHLLCLYGTAVAGSQSPLYVNGVAGAAAQVNTGFDMNGTFDALRLCRQASAGLPFQGDLAEAAIWWTSAGINVAQYAYNLGVLLQAPSDQAVPPDIYYPLVNDYTTDLGKTPTPLTLIGGVPPTYTDHPPIGHPPAPPQSGGFFLTPA